MAKRTFRVWRGDAKGGVIKEYPVEMGPGMVVLDALHRIQAEQAGDLAVRRHRPAAVARGRPPRCRCVRDGPHPRRPPSRRPRLRQLLLRRLRSSHDLLRRRR